MAVFGAAIGAGTRGGVTAVASSDDRTDMTEAERDGVPQADVLRRQIAVALQYDPDNDVAPRVTASGKGELAERVLELAFANGVKVREDADLAEMLVAVEVGEIIPLEAFAAVAEIIAYLYRANAGLPEPDGRVVEDDVDSAGATEPGILDGRGEPVTDADPPARAVAGGTHGAAAGYRPVGGQGPASGYGPTGAWRGTGSAPAGAGGRDATDDDAQGQGPRHRPRSV